MVSDDWSTSISRHLSPGAPADRQIHCWVQLDRSPITAYGASMHFHILCHVWVMLGCQETPFVIPLLVRQLGGSAFRHAAALPRLSRSQDRLTIGEPEYSFRYQHRLSKPQAPDHSMVLFRCCPHPRGATNSRSRATRGRHTALPKSRPLALPTLNQSRALRGLGRKGQCAFLFHVSPRLELPMCQSAFVPNFWWHIRHHLCVPVRS